MTAESPLVTVTMFRPPPEQIAPSSNGQLQITWPEAAIGYTLERTTNLSAPESWTAVTSAISSGGGRNIVTVTNGDSAVIYRLKQ